MSTATNATFPAEGPIDPMAVDAYYRREQPWPAASLERYRTLRPLIDEYRREARAPTGA